MAYRVASHATKQVTRGHNIVAEGWAGASNSHPHPMLPHQNGRFSTFRLVGYGRTDGRTEGRTKPLIELRVRNEKETMNSFKMYIPASSSSIRLIFMVYLESFLVKLNFFGSTEMSNLLPPIERNRLSLIVSPSLIQTVTTRKTMQGRTQGD